MIKAIEKMLNEIHGVVHLENSEDKKDKLLARCLRNSNNIAAQEIAKRMLTPLNMHAICDKLKKDKAFWGKPESQDFGIIAEALQRAQLEKLRGIDELPQVSNTPK